MKILREGTVPVLQLAVFPDKREIVGWGKAASGGRVAEAINRQGLLQCYILVRAFAGQIDKLADIVCFSVEFFRSNPDAFGLKGGSAWHVVIHHSAEAEDDINFVGIDKIKQFMVVLPSVFCHQFPCSGGANTAVGGCDVVAEPYLVPEFLPILRSKPKAGDNLVKEFVALAVGVLEIVQHHPFCGEFRVIAAALIMGFSQNQNCGVGCQIFAFESTFMHKIFSFSPFTGCILILV